MLHPTAQGNVLNGARVGGLCHKQFRKVVAQPSDPVGTGQYDHALFHVQGAGRGNFGTSIDHMLDNTQPARANVGQIGNVTQVRNADAVFNCGFKNTGSFGSTYLGSVYIDIDILYHLSSSSD